MGLSLGMGLLYSGLALRQGWGDAFVVQDDARQHVFWMQRFLDPELFPNDLIADYFQSVAPWGYRLLYQVGAFLGLEPFTFNWLLPVPITLIITLYCFRLTMALLPVPFTAFVSTVLLNQAVWLNSDVASATPRAFLYPLLLAFLYYLVEGALLPCLCTLLLQGLFYPQTLMLSLGVLVLRLVRFQGPLNQPPTSLNKTDLDRTGRQESAGDNGSQVPLNWPLNWPLQQGRWLPRFRWVGRAQRRFGWIAIATAFSILIIYAFQSSTYGPTITKAEALELPEFWPGGRSSFFSDSVWKYWFRGRSGILHRNLLTPATQALALLLPYFYWRRSRNRLPLLSHCRNLNVLAQLSVASIGMFFVSHALLFRLHLPSRYVQHSLRMVLAIGAAIVITSWIDALQRWWAEAEKRERRRWAIAQSCSLFLMASVVLYPLTLENFLSSGYVDTPAAYRPLYQYLTQQPKDTLVASLSRATDSIGTFSARSTWVSREHSIPYHMGYYRPLRLRLRQLIAAQYAPDLVPLQTLIREEGITHWLLDHKSFSFESLADDDWLLQFQPEMDQAVAAFESGKTIALADPALQEKCSVYNQQSLILLSADCLLKP